MYRKLRKGSVTSTDVEDSFTSIDTGKVKSTNT